MKRALLLFGGKFDFDVILMLEVISLKKVRAPDPVLESKRDIQAMKPATSFSKLSFANRGMLLICECCLYAGDFDKCDIELENVNNVLAVCSVVLFPFISRIKYTLTTVNLYCNV